MSTAVAGIAQVRDEPIIRRSVKINLRASIWEAVHELAEKGIPIGFEAREHWNVDTDPKVILHNGTVEEILDSIVKQDVFYNWEETDGVINIYPVMDRYKKGAAFLAKRIGPFSVSAGDDRASTVDKMSNLFDGEKGNEIEFHSFIGRGNILGLPNEFKEQLDFPASDVKTILNKLTKAQPYTPLWTVTPSENRKALLVVF